MNLSAIMACDIKGGVAKNGTLPWPKSKEDFKIFKDFTKNRKVIMGRKTWEDPAFPKPLPNRTNIVMSRSNNFEQSDKADIVVSGKIKNIIENMDNLIVIGGAELFKQFYPYIYRLSISLFHDDYQCDTFIDVNKVFYDYQVVDKKVYKNFTHMSFIKI